MSSVDSTKTPLAFELYTLSDSDKSCTANGNIDIENIQGCNAAIDELKSSLPSLRFKKEVRNRFWPKGCYYRASFNGVYFNTHPKGKLSQNAQPICKKAN